MKTRRLTDAEDVIMRDAVCLKNGAANYLLTYAIETLLRDGLVSRRNEHSVIATEYGKKVWFNRG